MNPLTEKYLITRVKAKDRRAAEKLIDAHYQSTYAFIYGFCKCRETAEDLTQETFMKVWKTIGSFNNLSRFSTWLYRIAYNTFIDWTRQRQMNPLLKNDNNPVTNFNSVDAFSENDLSNNILVAVRDLPKKLSEVVVLHYQNELSFGEISKILEVPKGTVKSRLNAALERLRASEIVKELQP